MSNQSLGRLTVDMVANTGSLEKDVGRATKSVQGFTKQTEEQRESLERLVGQLDPTVAAYSKLDKMEEQLRKHRKSGQLDPKEYERFTQIIQKQRMEVEKSSLAYGANSKTAKELAFSARGLPAQFTDIAVSLQGGQRPLTVLLQQGGQLKDMFGGIGPAIRYMTSYVVGLINPLTVAAAAAGALAFGFMKGRSESDAFMKSMAMTGNQAGLTTDQFTHMARSIDNIVGTQAAATAALSMINEKGRFTEQQFEDIAIAALKFQKATGQELETTIDQFSELGKDPVKAVVELNKQYNFLTASTYQQIAALQQEGDAIGAAELAYKAFSDTLEERADSVNDNLGVIQRGWRAIVSLTKEAGDALLAVGRSSTLEDELADIEARLENTSRLRNFDQSGLQARRSAILQEIQLRDIRADAEASAGVINRDAIAAQQALNEALRETKTDAEKLQKRYEEIEKQVARAALAGIYYTDEQVEALRRVAREQFSDKGRGSLNAAEKLIASLKEQNVVLNAQLGSVAKLSKAEQDLIEWNHKISEIKNKEVLTADEQSLLLNEDAITLQYERNAQVERELAGREAINKTMDDFHKMMKSLQTDEEELINLTAERLRILEEARAAGLSPADYQSALGSIVSQSIESAPDVSGAIGENAGESAQMRRISKAQTQLDEWYKTQLSALNQNRAARADLNEQWNEVEAKMYEEYMVNSAALGLTAQEIRLEESNKQFEKFADSAAKNMQSAFADFLFNPFEDGVRGMAKGFVDALRRMMAEVAAAKALEAGLNFLTNSTNPVLSSIGNIFGGSRDSGGRGEPGKSYLIGQGAQPEMFIPDQSGTFIPNADELGMGQQSLSFQFSVDATDPGAEARIKSMIEREVFPKIVEVATGRTIAQIRRPRFS